VRIDSAVRHRAPREEYHPTARGRDLVTVLRELIRRGQRHVPGAAERPPAGVTAKALRLIRQSAAKVAAAAEPAADRH